MIRASISAREGIRLKRLAGLVLGREDSHKCIQTRVCVILDNGGGPTRRVASHILVNKGYHSLVLVLVCLVNIGRTQKTAFFAAVPVELQRVLWGETSLGEDTKGLENYNAAGRIVISTRRHGGGITRGGVIMGPKDH
jgi:hypothetical protein